MNWTVDEGVQEDVHTEPHADAATREPMVKHQHAADTEPEAQEPLAPQAASDQVVVGDIPAEPPGFRPRTGLLAELDRAGAGVSVIYAQAGRTGLGATQLAAAYARAKLAAGWRLVAWVNAADAGSTQAGLAAVAEAAGLTDDGSGPGITDAGQAVRQFLEADGDRCLLVFDDAADPEALRSFVPADGTAQVLITSPRHPAVNLEGAVPVDVFSADEALSFLTGQTRLDDQVGAAAVAAELGYLPLALALATPVISGQRHGFARYLDRLQTMPADVSLTGDDGQGYPQSARAVLLSLAATRVPDKTGICARIMAIMAVLSPAGVRRELLHVAGRAAVLDSSGRRVEAALVDQVLEWLSGRSLLTFSLDGQTVMMHRLVAQVVRHGLVRRRRLGAVCWVAASVLEAHAIAVAKSQDRPAVRRIPQYVTALLAITAELAEEADEELAEILLRLRFISLYHLTELGDSALQAIAVGEPLTADLELLLGPGHPDTLNARNSLAAAYLAADRIADAIPLFEQTLAVLQRQLGPDHPDTLISQNNLASAYQDAGRVAEAIQIYELNLTERERQLGADHPGTLTSRGNLAAAYLAAGRAAEAIPMLEETLASRERVLGPDHPETQTSRRNLARAYQDVGRTAEATPLLERTLVGRHRLLRPDHPHTKISRQKLATAYRDEGRAGGRGSQAPAAGNVPPAGFRRPPADPATPMLPAGFRRPPADPATRLSSDRVVSPYARRSDQSSPSRKQDAPLNEAEYDHEVVTAITAGDPTGIAMAYDRYGAALYGYCHWMLHDSAAAAESLQDTFVLAAATLRELPEHSKLRPWLLALARNDCRRRVRPRSTIGEEAHAADLRADERQPADEADQPAAAVDDATMPFPAVSESAGAIGELADTTMKFRAVSVPAARIGEPADATMKFRAVSEAAAPVGEPADATMQFRMLGELADATMQFRMVSRSSDATDGLADVDGYLGQTELRALIRSTMADMKPREREVIELKFRHDLNDNDLAIALGMSFSRAHALAARTHGRLEKALGALRTALAGRQACPVVGELLADWDGQMGEQTRDLVAWHMEQCQTCLNQAQGALRPTVLSGLLPLAPLPPELREKVLSRCSSTSEDAADYRRGVVRRAESTWAAASSQVIRWVSWDSIQANLGLAIAATAIAVWVAAAVSVSLLTFAGSHAAQAQPIQPTGSHVTHAQAAQTSAGTPSRSPAATPTTATAPTSAAAKPSPMITQPSADASSQVQPSPSLGTSESSSPKPSRSSSPKPSKSPSPSPSRTTSPSPSPSGTASPSSSPSPTA